MENEVKWLRWVMARTTYHVAGKLYLCVLRKLIGPPNPNPDPSRVGRAFIEFCMITYVVRFSSPNLRSSPYALDISMSWATLVATAMTVCLRRPR
jgi:hypothetical protein